MFILICHSCAPLRGSLRRLRRRGNKPVLPRKNTHKLMTALEHSCMPTSTERICALNCIRNAMANCCKQSSPHVFGRPSRRQKTLTEGHEPLVWPSWPHSHRKHSIRTNPQPKAVIRGCQLRSRAPVGLRDSCFLKAGNQGLDRLFPGTWQYKASRFCRPVSLKLQTVQTCADQTARKRDFRQRPQVTDRDPPRCTASLLLELP